MEITYEEFLDGELERLGTCAPPLYHSRRWWDRPDVKVDADGVLLIDSKKADYVPDRSELATAGFVRGLCGAEIQRYAVIGTDDVLRRIHFRGETWWEVEA